VYEDEFATFAEFLDKANAEAIAEAKSRKRAKERFQHLAIDTRFSFEKAFEI